MKKFSIIAVVLIMALSLAACGRNNDNAPSTDMTILPDLNPTIDTNIPDPDVDSQMPIYTDGTDGSIWTGPSDATGSTNSQGRSGF